MPRLVNCNATPCFLKTPEGENAKFCQECGAASAAKVTVVKLSCPSCAVELEDSARFCSECGTRVQSEGEQSRLAKLLEGHVRPGAPTTGRGLTAEEAARIEESARRPSRVSDPTREYTVDPEHAKIMGESGMTVPEGTEKEIELAKGRTAIVNPDGKHVAGGLSADRSIPTSEGIKVIPYRFKTPARSGPTPVTGKGGGGRGGHISTTEADSFFVDDGPGDDVDDFFRDDPEPQVTAALRNVTAPRRDVTAAQSARKKAAAASAAKVRAEDAEKTKTKRPEDRKKCHECGRIMNDDDECPFCIQEDGEMSVEELSGLWD